MKSHSIVLLAVIVLWIGSAADAKYSGGTGEPNDPYRIATAEDLNDIGNHEEDWDKHFILVNDVDLAGYTGTSFKIIGRYVNQFDPNNKPFTGVFEGNDHKIWNFTWDSKGRDYVGLFGYIDSVEVGSGQIKNLGMENVDVNVATRLCVGGLVGYSHGGTITNCYSTGGIIGKEGVGGLVGYNDGTITKCCSTANCYSTAKSSENSCVGGLVGNNGHGMISACYSTGSVIGNLYVGGLAGFNNDGRITNCCSSGSVSGTTDVGGLVGSSGGTVSNCYSTGSVTGTGDIVGGLVGYNYYGTITNSYSIGGVSGSRYVGGLVGFGRYGGITDCYSTGSVSGKNYLGGLLGYNSYGEITNCYSTGSVTGTTYVGGMLGYDSGGAAITASFWDTQTSGLLTSAGGTPKTTGEMKTKSMFTDAGWDFVGETINGINDIWRMCVDDVQYPLLSWQFVTGDFICPDGVDFVDFALLASAWQSKPGDANWNPACDISNPKDSVIDELDLAVLCENWLEGTTP